MPLTEDVFRKHLTTGPFIGVYPSLPHDEGAACVWGCTDIDYDDGGVDAGSLHDALEAVGINSWVEKTRRGWHVWVFATTLTPAWAMRNMFLAAHQVVGLNPKEVNPKQTVLQHGQLGNYVRLPYPAGADATERIMYDQGQPLGLEDFLYRACETQHTPADILRVAEYYSEPVTQEVVIQSTDSSITEITRHLTALGWTIFQQGPLEGRDRSTTLAHLTHECAKSGITAGEALKILEDADLRWGKYLARGMRGQQELEKLVLRAYGTPST